MALEKSSKFTHPALAPSLASPPCLSLPFFSLALSESEQRVSQIRELIGSMPKPNRDTLQCLLEHLCRSGRLDLSACGGRGEWGMRPGLRSGAGKVGDTYASLLFSGQREETDYLWAGHQVRKMEIKRCPGML